MPKRKATAKPSLKKAESVGTKKRKEAVAELKKSSAGDKSKRRTPKVDFEFPWIDAGAEVYEDYDCMLNQTNIGHNNNKYYVIQIVIDGNADVDTSTKMFYTWNRWGRVGEPGQNSLKGPFVLDTAVKEFEKKFRDKTKNAWSDRDSFKPRPGKYTLLEMDDDDDDVDDLEDKATTVLKDSKASIKTEPGVEPSQLDKPTQNLMKLIFDTDMFNDAMKNFDIDVKKMPLGKLSKSQIAKGFECLERLEQAIKDKKTRQYMPLTSEFYTLVPHDFGRQRPPVINSLDVIRAKYDMLLVLADIELTQTLQKGSKKKASTETKKEPNPLDSNYGLLQCDLEYLDPKSPEVKLLTNYMEMTKGGGKIKNIWKVNRHTETQGRLTHLCLAPWGGPSSRYRDFSPNERNVDMEMLQVPTSEPNDQGNLLISISQLNCLKHLDMCISVISDRFIKSLADGCSLLENFNLKVTKKISFSSHLVIVRSNEGGVRIFSPSLVSKEAWDYFHDRLPKTRVFIVSNNSEILIMSAALQHWRSAGIDWILGRVYTDTTRHSTESSPESDFNVARTMFL